MFLTYFFEIKAEITSENSEIVICENIWRVAQKLQNDFQQFILPLSFEKGKEKMQNNL